MKALVRTRARAALVAAVVAAALPGQAHAQSTGTIQGQVVDASSGRPLAEAQISVQGTGIGMLTTSGGRFLLLNVPAGDATVRVQLIGYQPASQRVQVSAGQTATLDFALAQTAISLDELVVTGQGQATARRALATSVDALSASEIASSSATTVDQLLQGRVAGATVNATSSQPGTGALINFRGASSVFGAQTPVIYVDGVRVDNAHATSAGTGGEQSSALAELLTGDIERIEITKGGAASTLFGSDAATGVIQIFTKKGTVGAPRVTARIEQGFDQPEMKYMLDMGLIFPDIVAAGGAPADFLAQNYFKTGFAQNYQLGVSGGTADVTYSIGGRITHSDGTQPKNESVVYSLRSGVQASVTDRLRLDFSGTFTRSAFDRLFNGTAIADPLTTFEVGDALFFSGAETLDEALRIFLMPSIDERVNRFLFSAGAQYRFTDVFQSRFTVGVDHRNSHQRAFQPIGFTPGEVEGALTRHQRDFTSVTFDLAGSINHPLTGPVTSSFTFGAQGFRDDVSVVQATGTTFALPGAPDFDEAAEIVATETNEQLFNGGIYFAEQVGLWDRLFLNAGIRLDAGSTFGDEVDFQAYPKAGASYLLSEEGFFQDALGSAVSSLKLRAAYGQTGKFPPPFLRDRTFDAIPFRGESAPRFDNPGNPDLKPEVTSTLEAGFDAAFWNNRIGLGFTWYDAVTKDALFDVPEQPVTGQGVQLRNVGEITNRGIEVDVSLQLVNTRSFAWSMAATYNQVDNEVTDMGSAAPFFVEDQKHVCGPPDPCGWPEGDARRGTKGRPVGAWFVTTPVDTNGDGLLDGSERLYTGGQPLPTRSGGIRTSLTLWNRLTLNALGDWATGQEVFDWGSVWATFNEIYRREIVEGVEFPVQYTADGEERGKYGQNAARSEFIYDGDWFKFREASARYALPEEWAARLGVERGTVFGSVRNVWTWSKNPLIDPELNGITAAAGGLTLGSESSITASPPRMFRFGVEVVF